jgi:TPP-dependent pyruvate/acetoin dehydrogenase alpha subunit
MDRTTRLNIFTTACLCRVFEERVYREIKSKRFSYPIYLSAGQEFIPATTSFFLLKESPLIFAQHRGHSTYLSYGGSPESLIQQLLYSPGGSASIHSPDIHMFGHDGLMGTQIPIAVGAAFSSKRLTVAIMGDASAEEDYVLTSIAWAGTKKLPIIFIVEDNNLSILTEKKIRRNWEIDIFARSVNVNAVNITDDPTEIESAITSLKLPMLLNIRTERLYWHAGAGEDDYPKQDRYKKEKEFLGKETEQIEEHITRYVDKLWNKTLEK